MLTSLHLANFKAFADEQRVPIRPLTLIFGANSAGKSSILHALLLANEAVRTGDLDVHYTKVGGASVDLGGFRQFVHQADATKRLTLRFDLKTPTELALFPAGSLLSVTVVLGLQHVDEMQEREGIDPRTGLPISIKVPTGKLIPVGDPYVQAFSLAVDGKDIAQIRAVKAGAYKFDLVPSHPLVEEMIRALLLFSTTLTAVSPDDVQFVQDSIAEYIQTFTPIFTGILPTQLEYPQAESEGQSKEIIPVARGTRQEDIGAALKLFLPARVKDMLLAPSQAIREWLSSLVYLGPLRSYPQRHLAFTKELDANWQAGGGHAWDVVRRNSEVREAVNAWLGTDHLSTPYALVVRDLIPDRYLSEELDAMYDELAEQEPERLDEIETRPATEEEVREFFESPTRGERLVRKLAQSSPDQLKDLVLIDIRNDTPVSHRDVGIGISQVLPVLVYSYANQEKAIAIEQPEIHLHPALQAELGDVFIESALGERKNTFLLETHSEHLILRIMRRIRETTAGTLPQGLTPIKPDDVAVLYVEPDGSRSIIREMELNANGEFVKSWPGGFFEEGLREIFA